MAEEYTDKLGIPSAIEPGFDPTVNPVAIFTEAMGTLSPRKIDGEPQTVKTGLYKSGNYKTGPNPGNRQGNGTMDFLNDQLNYASQAMNWSRDADAYGRTYFYGAGIHGANYERYYRHPKFKELGFSPQRNNEVVYNQASSWWDDFNRMSTSLGNLFMTGFKSPFDFGSKDTAREMEKEMAIGMTTRGGVGGFFTNLALNTGFTLGIAAEMIAENFAIAGLTYATGGLAAAPAAAAAVGRNAMGMKKLYQLGDTISATRELLKKLTNAATAKDFYSKANGTSVLGKAVDFLNPLGHTAEYARDLAKGANGVDKLNDFAKTRKAFGAFYRDLREANLTVSESLMEGEMVSNEKNRQKIDAYYRKHGYMPQGKDAEDIYNQSRSIGFATAMANMPTIFLTNRLVFDNIFRGFKPPSVVGKEIIEGTARTAQKNKNWKIGDNAYSFQERMAKNKLSKILWDNPYVPWSRKYMLGNLGEGVQEMSQEIVSSAATKYYERLYSDPAASGLLSSLVAVGQGAGDQFNVKGLETFLSGYLTGSIVQGTGALLTSHKWAPGLYKEYFNTEEYKKELSGQRERENQIANAANTILKDPLGYFSENVEHALRVKELNNGMEQAELDGDQKAFHDNKNDLLYEHLYVMARTGKMSMIEEQLDDLMQLDDQGLTEAFSQSIGEAQAIRTRLSDAKQKAQQFQATYNAFVDKYQNPFNPMKFDPEKNMQEFLQEKARYIGFEKAREDAILSSVLYGKTLERMDNMVQDLASDPMFKDSNASDITILMDERLLNDEIDVLTKEISVLSLGDQKQKEEAKKKQQKKENLISLRDYSFLHTQAMEDMRAAIANEEIQSVMHTPGSVVKKKTNGEILTVVGLRNKDRQLIVMNQYGKKKFISKRSVIPVVSGVHKQVRDANSKMYEAFKKYMMDIASNTGAVVDEVKLQRAFIKFRDHMALKGDAKRLIDTANMLNNPEYFVEHSRRMAERELVKMENLPEYIRSSYESLMEKYKNNQFLNEIFDLGYTIDPEDVDEILYDQNYDVELYYANTGQKVEPDDPQYEKAQRIIQKYQEMADIERGVKTETGEEYDQPDMEEEVETPVSEAVPAGAAAFDVDTKLYKDLVALFRSVEKQKADKGESTFGLENIPDEELTVNEDFIEFTKTNGAAIRIIKNAPLEEKKAEEEAAKKERQKLDWTPPPVPPGLEPLRNLFKKVLHITEDEKNYFDKEGNLYDRVSSMKPDKEELKAVSAIIKRRAVQRGNVIDRAIRELFMGNIETREDLLNLINSEIRTNNYEIDFTKSSVDALFKTLGEIKQAADKIGWKVYSDIPTLFGNYPGLKLPNKGRVAGTIDLLVEFNGDFFLIDIKTATRDRASEEGQEMYMDSDTIQMNVYRELIEQRTGVKLAGMFIFPITVTHGPRYKTVESISAPKFGPESLIEIPVIPVKQLVPELFEKGPEAPPAAPSGAAPAAPATPAPTATAVPVATAPAAPATEVGIEQEPAQKKKFKGDELQKMIDSAKNAAGYEKLKKALYRILSSNPHFRDHFNMTSDSVKKILADKYNELAMTFTKDDIKQDLYVKTKDGRNMQVVNVTKDTFTIAPVTSMTDADNEIYSMSKVYDVIDSTYKEMEKVESPVTPKEEVTVEKSTQKVSDKSVQDGQLTADKVNQLNGEVNSQSQEDIDNDVLRTLCES